MSYHATIYFLGKYKPVHFEARNLRILRDNVYSAIQYTSGNEFNLLKSWTDDGIANCAKSYCASFSAEYGALGVHIGQGKRDRFLDNALTDMPLHPSILYYN